MMSYCKKSIRKKKRGRRFLTWVLWLCIMLTGYSDLSVGGFVFAQEQESLSGNDMPAADIALPEEQESVSGNSTQPDINWPEEDTALSGLWNGQEVNKEQAGGDGTRAEVSIEKVKEPDKPELSAQESVASEAALQSQPEAMWQEQRGGEWMYGSLQEAVGKVYSGGKIILQSDVSLTSEITISRGINTQMRIISPDSKHPYTIKNTSQDTDDRKNSGRIFTVTAGAVFLQDIILDGGRNEGVTAFHPLICLAGQNAVLIMCDGAVLQNAENVAQSFCGGGINIRQGRAFMYDGVNGGGKIMNCKARHGGGIEVNCNVDDYRYASFAMTGGSIENCEADDGGGVYVNIGMFQMERGKIEGNRATKEDTGVNRTGGGGIYMAGEAGVAAVRIAKKGKIIGNTGSNGGGILVDGAYAQLYVEGGSVEGNTAQNGGGVSMIMGTMRLHGGTVTGNTARSYGGGILGSPDSVIELQGNPKVFGNTAGDTTDRFDNLYLDGDEDSTATGVTVPVLLTGPLTEGVKIGMSRWLYPDEAGHPYRDMIVPHKGYTISQSDIDQLCYDRPEPDEMEKFKGLYTDNMDKYALIPYDGKIVMVMAVDISFDKKKISLESVGNTASLIATVTPADAPLKDVTWSSSNEAVATVGQDGTVTAIGEGEAVITATTVSPYHASVTCRVKVGIYRYQLTTGAMHGRITYTPVSSDGIVKEDDQVTLQLEPDPGYRLKEGSLSARWTDDQSETVKIEGNTFTMPEHDTTVSAVFEPIPYQIVYHLEGGALKESESNPDFYTIESSEITLNNPVRSGYRFIGWKGVGLTDAETIAKIPSGSMGAREYTAVWEKEDSHKPDDPNPPQKPDASVNTGDTGDNQYVDNSNKEEAAAGQAGLPKNIEQSAAQSDGAEPQPTQTPKTVRNPRTGNHILWLYIAAVLSAACMMFLTFLRINARGNKRAKMRVKKRTKKKKGTRTRSHAAAAKSKPKRRRKEDK